MNKLVKYLTLAATIAVAVFLIWYFSAIVWYMVMALVVSLVGAPLVRLIQSVNIRGWHPPSALAAALTLVAILGLVVLSAWGMVPLIAAQFHELKAIDPARILSLFNEPLAHLQESLAGILPDSMRDFSIQKEIADYFIRLFDASFFTTVFSSTAALLTDLLIALFSVSFISFFFLKEEKLSMQSLTFFFPSRYEENLKHAMVSSKRLLFRYFVGLIIESGVIIVLTTPGMMALGLPFNTSLVIGILSGILNVIPYVGALISLAVSLIIAAAMFATSSLSLSLGTLLALVCVIFLVVRLVDNFFLQPYIYASSANAHPLEIFIILLMAGQIAGVIGMLVAIPAYTVLRVFAKEFFNNFHIVQRLTKNI